MHGFRLNPDTIHSDLNSSAMYVIPTAKVLGAKVAHRITAAMKK